MLGSRECRTFGAKKILVFQNRKMVYSMKVFITLLLAGLFCVTGVLPAQAEPDTPLYGLDDSVSINDSLAMGSSAMLPAEADSLSATPPEGVHQVIKEKFIEGNAGFMSLVAIALVLGLALCIERIIYLSLADIDSKKLLSEIDEALQCGEVEMAKDICRNTRGPVASICYQGLLRIDENIDVVERSIVSYGTLQAGYLEKGCSWITLFITIAPSLGFLGTVIGMVMAFEAIEQAGDISSTIVAAGMKVALITTIFGLIVALVLQIFYNYILSKIESITAQMEDAAVSLLDMILKYDLSNRKR